MPWLDVEKPGPKPGLMIKMLHRNPLNGFYSRLIWAKPGWDDHRLAHHPCYEEAYTLGGTMEYNFGDLIEGTYFFRPARVKHGHFISGEPDGCFWLIRSDGDLINWYTINEAVIVEGEALNYDADKEGPVVSSMPVRSRRTGPWTGDGIRSPGRWSTPAPTSNCSTHLESRGLRWQVPTRPGKGSSTGCSAAIRTTAP